MDINCAENRHDRPSLGQKAIHGMDYRRAWQAGGTYFFTVNLAVRSCTLLVDHVDHLRDVVRKVRQAHPFDILAWVVMPDHLHAVWTMPEGDADYATRWMLIKAGRLG